MALPTEHERTAELRFAPRDPIVAFVAVPTSVGFALFISLAGVPLASLVFLLAAVVFWQYAHRSVTISESEWVFEGALRVTRVRRDAVTSIAVGIAGYGLRGYGWELGVASLAIPSPGDLRGGYDERRERLESLVMIESAGDSRQEPVRKARFPSVAATLTFVVLAVACSLLAMASASL